MVDPCSGFLAEEKFLTIAALNAWFDKEFPPQSTLPEHRRLPPPADPVIAPEIRARCIAKLKAVARKMREDHLRDEKRRHSGASTFQQVHIPEKLLEALAFGKEPDG